MCERSSHDCGTLNHRGDLLNPSALELISDFPEILFLFPPQSQNGPFGRVDRQKRSIFTVFLLLFSVSSQPD